MKTAGSSFKAIALLIFATFSGTASAQWLKFTTPGVPRKADGKPNLTAPAPRKTDGKPDVSGLWRKDSAKYYYNVAADLEPGGIAPWADALYQRRKLDFGKDSMEVLCQPLGPAYTTSPFIETRIVEAPGMIVMLNNDLTHREIFMDGRTLEKDPNPSRMGYSVGHWEGDTLVVESNGYTDNTWLDGDGHPHTDELHVTERYTRRDFGHMDVQVTFTDPQVFPKPVVVPIVLGLRVDTEMLEFYCENEKDRAHMPSVQTEKELQIAPEVLARYVGTYDIGDEGKTIPVEFAASGNTLYYDWDHEGRQPLSAIGLNLFSLGGTPIEFILAGDGPATEVLIRTVEGEDRGRRRK